MKKTYSIKRFFPDLEAEKYAEQYAEQIVDFLEQNELEDNEENRNSALDTFLQDDRERYYDNLYESIKKLGMNYNKLIKYGTCGSWNGLLTLVPTPLNGEFSLHDLMKDCDEVTSYGVEDGVFFLEGYHHDGDISVRLLPLRKNRLDESVYNEGFFYAFGNKDRESIEKRLIRYHAKRFTQEEAEQIVY